MSDHTEPYEFTPSRYFLVRLAALSSRDVEPLDSPRSVEWADRVLDLEQRLQRAKPALEDALAAAIGGTDDADQRRRLLAIRRDVHNLRLPTADAVDRAVLESAAREQLDSWLAHRTRYEGELAAGAEVINDELGQARTHLRRLGQDQRLRQGIQLGAPQLERALPGYLGASAEKAPSKRARGVERSLVHYVFRAAFKTSPFSSFTRLCLGQFADNGGAVELDFDATTFQDIVTFNLAGLGSLAQAVPLSDEIRRVLPVELTTGWRIEDSRIRYVRRQYGYNSDPTAPTLGLLEEVDFSVPRGEVVDEIITIAQQEPGISLDGLIDRLHATDPAARPWDRLAVYVDRLVELGLLIPRDTRLDPSSADPVTDFADRLAKLRSTRATEVADRVRALAESATRYESADPAQRARLVSEAHEQVEQAQRTMGRTSPVPLRTVFYEDSVSTQVATANRRWWDAALLPQLERLTSVLPAFDPLVVDRLLAKGYFRDRHGHSGSCDDIPGFAHEFQRRCASWLASHAKRDRSDVDEDADSSPLPRHDLAALRKARDVVAEEMRRQVPEDEVSIDDELLARVREPLVDLLPSVLPASFFLQLVNRSEDDWRAALNFGYTGLGMPIGRFSYPLARATGHPLAERLREQATATQPGSAVFAEITGGYDASNLSWHDPITPYQIVGPAEISFRPPEQQVPIDDLVLTDDPDTDELRLYSKRLGARVIPVYLGSLMPVALPEVQRTLLALSCTMMPSLNFQRWITTRRVGELEEHPRVRYRNIVLQRRTWSVPSTALPGQGRGLADDLLDWRRWWHGHRLPERMFYTVPTRTGGTRTRVAEKPQYVSAGSVLSLRSFAHDVRRAAGPVRLTEMLPDHAGAWPIGDRDSYASELCVDITGVRKGIT